MAKALDDGSSAPHLTVPLEQLRGLRALLPSFHTRAGSFAEHVAEATARRGRAANRGEVVRARGVRTLLFLKRASCDCLDFLPDFSSSPEACARSRTACAVSWTARRPWTRPRRRTPRRGGAGAGRTRSRSHKGISSGGYEIVLSILASKTVVVFLAPSCNALHSGEVFWENFGDLWT